MLPKASVLPYDLVDPLFTDYAHKQRFGGCRAGSKATWVSDDALLDFPVGTMLIETFYDGVLPANERKIAGNAPAMPHQQWVGVRGLRVERCADRGHPVRMDGLNVP
ncbi:MAG: hypothetical protein R2810_03510 [Flavobacteriales bacterium]